MYPIYSADTKKLGTTDIDNCRDLAFELNLDESLIAFAPGYDVYFISLTKEEFERG